MKRISLETDSFTQPNTALTSTDTVNPMTRDTSLSPVTPSLGVDGLMLLVAGIAAYLFGGAIAMAKASATISQTLSPPPMWLVVVSILLIPVWFIMFDLINMASNRLKLPFAGTQQRAQRIFAKRTHLFLLSLYFNAILVGLCWSAPAMPLFSKLFLSAVFSIAIYALGQSIPSTKLSFVLSGVLFAIVLIASQSFIVFKMQAEEAAAEQELREQLGSPVEEDDDDNNAL
ncbi:MAG: hypothetical protein AAGF01_20350 [Cyanobacteria bacterium P01_G01_bin.38]